jgi:dolichyl-phosphate beta-glucosyltransferase
VFGSPSHSPSIIMPQTMLLSVIIPAYNEESRLLPILNASIAYFDNKFQGQYEILVVDDGSIDDTAKIALDYAAGHSNVHLLQYGRNRGKGYAVRHGMLNASGQWRLFCDADLATPIEEFDVVHDRMVADKTEIGIGSRPLRESHLIVHQPWYRELMGRGFNKVVQMLAVPGIQDTQCGFKIFSARAAAEVFGLCVLDRFAFDAEALFVARRLGYRISEVPIRWSHKSGSKVSMLRDGTRMIYDLMRIRALHRAVVRNIEPQTHDA